MSPLLSALCLLGLCAAPTVAEEPKTAPAPNGLEIPEGFENWAVISVSHRLDRESMRVILGNDIAVKAARSGQTSPWPDGDSKKFAANVTGWGWARWVGPNRTPYGKDASFEKECIECHSPVSKRDWAFTHPAAFR